MSDILPVITSEQVTDELVKVIKDGGLDRIQKPSLDWEFGFKLLISGICPWCHKPISNLSSNVENGLSWACYEGCNP